MLCAGPGCKVGTAFTDKLERQCRADAVDLGQVNAQHTVKRGTNLEVRRVRLFGFGPDFGKIAGVVILIDGKVPERGFQLPVTFQDFSLVEIVQRQRLAQRKDVLIAPVSRQGRTDFLCG